MNIPNRPEEYSKIDNIWCFFAHDFNFKSYDNGMLISKPGDYPELTPKKFFDWIKNNANTLAWHQYKLQNGHTIFPSKVASSLLIPSIESLSPDYFKCVCELCKEEGIYNLAYTCGGDDVYAFSQHPEWFKEYGFAYACLNADPYWEREFDIVREALTIFPCKGLFYDMILFSGKCRCDFCQSQYINFYGEKMPEQHDIRRFRLDTFKRWVDRAIKAGRDIVPEIEISINNQWHKEGLPIELLHMFDWVFIEFGNYAGLSEIFRAFCGDKHIFSLCGEGYPETGKIIPRQMANLLSRRIAVIAGDIYLNSTGEVSPENECYMESIKQNMEEVKKMQAYLTGAVEIPHSSVLFSTTTKSNQNNEEEYMNIVSFYVDNLMRINLNCCNVEILEQLTEDKINKYEVIFAPEVGWVGDKTLDILYQWVYNGGILFVNGFFALKDQTGCALKEFEDNGLLGIKLINDSVNSDVLTALQLNSGVVEIEELIVVNGLKECESITAEPVVFGKTSNHREMPLIWRNELGKGFVFYLSSNTTGGNLTKDHLSLRTCFKTLLHPCIKRAPFQTTIEYPAEVFLNIQPALNRLVLHVNSYEKPLVNQRISIREDLIAEAEIELVYPADKKIVIKGERNNRYCHFVIPEAFEHLIFTLRTP